jgi:hypothetical protein
MTANAMDKMARKSARQASLVAEKSALILVLGIGNAGVVYFGS